MKDFEITGNVLRIFTDLDLDAEAGFKEACIRLLRAEGTPIYLDLAAVGFVGSSFFGQMFMLNYQAKKQGRELVLRAPAHLMSIMELLGLPQLLRVEVVEKAPAHSTDEA